MLDPPRAGFTNTGKPSSAIASKTRLRSAAAVPAPGPGCQSRSRTTTYGPMGSPWAAKTSFMYSLSRLTALARTPAPTYGTPGPGHSGIRPGDGSHRGQRPAADGQPLRLVSGENPPAIGEDADGHHLVAVPVERGQHGTGAHAGHWVLRALAAEHHRHLDLALLVQRVPSSTGAEPGAASVTRHNALAWPNARQATPPPGRSRSVPALLRPPPR